MTKKRLTIAIDVREAVGTRAGKGRVVEGLLAGLAEDEAVDIFYRLYTKEPLPEDLIIPANAEVVVLPKIKLPGYRILWVAWDLWRRRIDFFLSPTGFLPAILSPVPAGIVVHDLAVWRYPSHERSVSFQEKFLLPLALRRVKLVFVVSKNTAKDLQDLFGQGAYQTILAYPAASTKYHVFQKEDSTDHAALRRIHASYHLPDKYLLAVGTLQPRKNIAGLIEAYHQLPERLRNDVSLVIVGKKGWEFAEVFERVRELNEADRIRFLDYVPEDDLPALYAGAFASAYVAHYEGFGLPALEALACGVPHLSSKTSSLPEVVGRAAVLVDPASTSAMTDGLEQLLTDTPLRKKLRELGPVQAHQFTWRAMAEVFENSIRNFLRSTKS